jgi:hypothetical protein
MAFIRGKAASIAAANPALPASTAAAATSK